MKASLLALLGLFVLVDATTLLRAEESDKRTWRLTDEADQPRLDYGTNNAEDTPIAFFCKAGQGRVEVMISETGRGVEPGRSMTASLKGCPASICSSRLRSGSGTTDRPRHASIARQASDDTTSVGRKCFRANVLFPDPLGPTRTTSDNLGTVIFMGEIR